MRKIADSMQKQTTILRSPNVRHKLRAEILILSPKLRPKLGLSIIELRTILDLSLDLIR